MGRMLALQARGPERESSELKARHGAACLSRSGQGETGKFPGPSGQAAQST